MLVFNFQHLEDFLDEIVIRIQNRVFSTYLEPETSLGASPNNHKLILQYLGKPDEKNVNLLALYQIKINIKSKNERDEIINRLQIAFKAAGGIKLIHGTITEIFQSIS